MEYLDFNLAIGPAQGRAYPVTVRSPAGEAHVTMTFPFDTLALDNRLKDLRIALLSSGGTRRGLLPEEETVQTFGRELFDLLITGEVRNRYDVSQERARQQGKGLRLKLSIQPPTLAALPWEYLYDARTGAYICLVLDTPIVRYLELPHPIAPLTVTPPLRILGMIVSPRDLPRLDVQIEKQRVERAVKALQEQGLVELTWLAGQSWRELRRALLDNQWQIFHFVGHGSFDNRREEGTIALADGAGDARFLTATEFGHLLADHRSLRLVLLNACLGARGGKQDVFSSTAATLVRRGIPAVVAMQEAITDQAAIEFAQSFYENLTSGLPVDAAVAEARKAILFEIANTLEWGTPVLYMRAPDGRIFDLHSLPKPPSEPTPPAPVTQPAQEQRITRKPQATPRKTRALWQWGVMAVLLLALGVGGFQYGAEILSALGFGAGAPPPTTVATDLDSTRTPSAPVAVNPSLTATPSPTATPMPATATATAQPTYTPLPPTATATATVAPTDTLMPAAATATIIMTDKPAPTETMLQTPRPTATMTNTPHPAATAKATLTATDVAGEAAADVEAIVAKASCTGCHVIPGVPGAVGMIGPNLSTIGVDGASRVEGLTGEEYIRQSILEPNAFIAPQCPTGPCLPNLMMKSLGEILSPEEIDAVVAYLSQLGKNQ